MFKTYKNVATVNTVIKIEADNTDILDKVENYITDLVKDCYDFEVWGDEEKVYKDITAVEREYRLTQHVRYNYYGGSYLEPAEYDMDEDYLDEDFLTDSINDFIHKNITDSEYETECSVVEEFDYDQYEEPHYR